MTFVKPKFKPDSKYKSFWKEYKDLCFEEYVLTIQKTDKIPNVVLVDGESRVACLEIAIETVSQGSLIVLDNSARDRYKDLVEEIKIKYKTLEFYGPTTYGQGIDSTLLIYT